MVLEFELLAMGRHGRHHRLGALLAAVEGRGGQDASATTTPEKRCQGCDWRPDPDGDAILARLRQQSVDLAERLHRIGTGRFEKHVQHARPVAPDEGIGLPGLCHPSRSDAVADRPMGRGSRAGCHARRERAVEARVPGFAAGPHGSIIVDEIVPVRTGSGSTSSTEVAMALLSSTYGQRARPGDAGVRRRAASRHPRTHRQGHADRRHRPGLIRRPTTARACPPTRSRTSSTSWRARTSRPGRRGFCRAVARRLLERYPGMSGATVSAHEVGWNRLTVDGAPHPHAFTFDGNGRRTAEVVMDRHGDRVTSGLSGFTFLKATASGWSNFVKDRYNDAASRRRIGSSRPAWRPPGAGRAIPRVRGREPPRARHHDARLRHDLQSQRPGQPLPHGRRRARRRAVSSRPSASPARTSHYLPVNLAPFGLDNPNRVFNRDGRASWADRVYGRPVAGRARGAAPCRPLCGGSNEPRSGGSRLCVRERHLGHSRPRSRRPGQRAITVEVRVR